MKKSVLILLSLLSTFSAIAAEDWGESCSKVKKVRVWGSGNDKYGLRIEMQNTYDGCEQGFYVRHSGENKSLVHQTALTALAHDLPACVQIALVSETLPGTSVCRLGQLSIRR